MHIQPFRLLGITAVALAAVSCTDRAVVAPPQQPQAQVQGAPALTAAAALPPVRFSEIHYDNGSTDVGEAIEISAPAGMDLTDWQVLLYNGTPASRAVYDTKTLSGTVPATCGARGVVVINYPSNGVQNGGSGGTATNEPDGMALVDPTGRVVEFLSYEGVFTAASGPAAGMTSTDIGVRQLGTEPIGSSLHRGGDGVWRVTEPLGTNSFGQCNDEDETPPGEVDRVELTPTSASITTGGTAQFVAVAFDAEGRTIAGVSFTWASNAPDVVSISATGLASALKPGTATLTATAPNGVASTAEITVGEAPPPPTGEVWLSELHYDNIGTDQGEAVEIEGPAGLDLTGWRVILYNGANGQSYSTRTLSGTIPSLCDGRGVVVAETPGIQNGDPDGVALIDATGAVVEFISYGGAFAATNGPALGVTSVDIGVKESNTTTPIGHSLQRTPSGVWQEAKPNTFGACNTEPPPPPAASPLVINEVMANPNVVLDEVGEWFELTNTGSEPIDLNGWTIVSGNSTTGTEQHAITRSVVVRPGAFVVLGRVADRETNGDVPVDYAYGTTEIFLSNTSDFLALRDPQGVTADSVTWGSSGAPAGISRALADPMLDNTDVGGANWFNSYRSFGFGDLGTPGEPNGERNGPPGVVVSVGVQIQANGGGPTQMPVGFTKPAFPTAKDGTGATLGGITFTWTSSDASVATVDELGYIRGVGVGSATIHATAPNGVSGQAAIRVLSATSSHSATYRDHLEFGTPTDADPSDDILIVKPQFTASYSPVRGGPNWVSWNLNASHFGDASRCNCFTADETLPAGIYRVVDYDYRNGGYDRGHMVQSESRTASEQENAATFLFTNILPQAANTNQGPWLGFENYLNDLARTQGKEIYVIAGGEYSANPETLKGEGKVQVPDFTWKVAAIVDGAKGLANVRSHADVQVIAVRMPNDTAGARSIRNTPWQQFITTVDAIEAAVGYDLLDKLPDEIERVVESNNFPPTARVGGPYSGEEGATIAFDGTASSDPENDALSFHWSFGDGTTASAPRPTHVYARNGSYTVVLTVTDAIGSTHSGSTTVEVRNVAPALSALPDTVLLPGETYTAAGSFGDPGAASWSAVVDYGDGAGPAALSLDGKSFVLSHRYAAAGSYTVRVEVSDGVDVGSAGAVVVVIAREGAVDSLAAQVEALGAAGRISGGDANALGSSLDAARQQILRGNFTAAANQLGAFTNKVEAMQRSGRLTPAEARPLMDAADRLSRSFSR